MILPAHSAGYGWTGVPVTLSLERYACAVVFHVRVAAPWRRFVVRQSWHAMKLHVALVNHCQHNKRHTIELSSSYQYFNDVL